MRFDSFIDYAGAVILSVLGLSVTVLCPALALGILSGKVKMVSEPRSCTCPPEVEAGP